MKKYLILFGVFIGLIALTYFFVFRDKMEVIEAWSDKMSPPVGCPREKVEEVFGEPELSGTYLYNSQLPDVIYFGEYKVESVDGQKAMVYIRYFHGKVVDSSFNYATEYGRFSYDKTIEGFIGDMRALPMYKKAVRVNYEIYGEGLEKLKKQKWTEPAYQDLIKVPKFKVPMPARPTIRVTLFDIAGQLYVNDMPITKISLAKTLVAAKNVCGNCPIEIVPEADSKMNIELIRIILSCGFTNIRIIGYSGFYLAYCPIGVEGPPPEQLPDRDTVNDEGIQLNRKTVIFKGQGYSFKEFYNFLKSTERPGFTGYVEIIGATTWQDFVDLSDALTEPSDNSRDPWQGICNLMIKTD